jgi:hypothetical protein
LAVSLNLRYAVSGKFIRREKLGNQMGVDGFYLLEKIDSLNAPEWLRFLPAVETLRKVGRIIVLKEV